MKRGDVTVPLQSTIYLTPNWPQRKVIFASNRSLIILPQRNGRCIIINANAFWLNVKSWEKNVHLVTNFKSRFRRGNWIESNVIETIKANLFSDITNYLLLLTINHSILELSRGIFILIRYLNLKMQQIFSFPLRICIDKSTIVVFIQHFYHLKL